MSILDNVGRNGTIYSHNKIQLLSHREERLLRNWENTHPGGTTIKQEKIHKVTSINEETDLEIMNTINIYLTRETEENSL